MPRLDFGGGSYGEPGLVHLFEFKVVKDLPRDGSARGAAMAQLCERSYADKYRGAREPVHLIAVEFSRQTGNLATFEAAPA